MQRLWPIIIIAVCAAWWFAGSGAISGSTLALAIPPVLDGPETRLLASALACAGAVGLAGLALVVERNRRDRRRRALVAQGLIDCVNRKTKENIATLRGMRRILVNEDFGGELRQSRWLTF